MTDEEQESLWELEYISESYLLSQEEFFDVPLPVLKTDLETVLNNLSMDYFCERDEKIEIDPEHLLRCWQIVETLRTKELPENF